MRIVTFVTEPALVRRILAHSWRILSSPDVRRPSPPPEAGILQIWLVPLAFEMKTIQRPSGDQAASNLSPGDEVSRRCCRSVRPKVKSCRFSPFRAMNRKRRPSGEKSKPDSPGVGGMSSSAWLPSTAASHTAARSPA